MQKHEDFRSVGLPEVRRFAQVLLTNAAMTPERWQKINELFHDALQRQVVDRSAFLSQACAGDDSLLQEIHSLIRSHENSDTFIEEPAIDIAADLLSDKQEGLKPGESVGPYEIVSLLGEGGMGEVYLAQDSRLGRKVALKLLPLHFIINLDRARRFEREARAASALNHPNIVTVHEIGQSDFGHFIATEFVDGKTLRQLINEKHFTLSETLKVVIQVAGALMAAHAAGIVHRDIKPENIMVRNDGYVKILDFGLAKLTEAQIADTQLEAPTLLQTNPGLVMGTVQYMSPEQARGKKVNLRTDLWSLGIVLYELLAGRVPFSGETPSHVMVSLMEDELPSLTSYANVPAELDRIVTKALRKSQKDRYRSAREFADDLKDLKRDLQVEARLKGMLEAVPSSTAGMTGAQGSSHTRALATETVSLPEGTAEVTRPTFGAQYLSAGIKRHKYFAVTALLTLLAVAIGLTFFLRKQNKTNVGASRKTSIAVLPVRPFNSAIRDEIYEIGIADSLIHRLSSIDGLVVRPLSATRQYDMTNRGPAWVGEEQKVDYVLSSQYQLNAGRIHVSSQLINIATGLVDVTYQSEKDAANVFATQDAVSDELANMLMTRFRTTTGRAEAKRGTTSEEAYRLYLQAMDLYAQRNERDWHQQWVELLDQAASLDPNYALAWAGEAHAHRYKANLGRETDTHSEYKKSMEAINRALSLNKDLSEAYSALCENKYYYEFDFSGAETACKRALALDPNSSQAHEIYGRFLYHRGRFPEGIKELETAVDLEPTSLVNQSSLGTAFYYAGLYDKAQAQFKRAIAMDLKFASAYSWFRNSLEMQGHYAEAFDWFIQLQGVLATDFKTVQLYQRIYQKSGYQAVLREYVERFDKSINQYYMGALLEADIGNKDKAFEYLEIAYQRREWGMNSLLIERRLDPIRDDPRFAELVARVGLK